jgi:hypothetical protein
MDEEKQPIKEKIKETFSDIKENNKLDEVYEYARSHFGETATYIALVLGLLLTLFGNFYGLPLIGFVAGLYFSKDILLLIDKAVEMFQGPNMLDEALIGAVLIALFLQAPMLFIGAAAAVVIRKVVLGMEVGADKPPPKDSDNGDGE